MLGPSGASAYEAWRGLGNTGSVADFLATLVGPQDADSTVPGPECRQGPDGAGSVSSRTAYAAIAPWTAVVADGPSNCLPADPFNAEHRGRLNGVTALGGASGASVTIQNLGDFTGPSAGFAPDAVLVPDANSVLTATLPMGALWRRPLSTVVSDGHIVLTLGEATLIPDDGDALIFTGGYATEGSAADLMAGTPGRYVPCDTLQTVLPQLFFRQPQLQLTVLDTLPLLPANPADYPEEGGLFRNRDASGYGLTRIYAVDGPSVSLASAVTHGLTSILLSAFDALATLPSDPTALPASGGLFRNGDANGYSLIRIYPER